MRERRMLRAIPILLLLVPLPGAQAQAESEEIEEAVELYLAFRYRYETVDEDGFENEARASTLRSVVGSHTTPVHGFSIRAEGEHVVDIGTDGLYNDAAGNGVGDRPTIADSGGGEINQAYLRFENDDLAARVGKQEILLDDVRFIGNVGWRQNHQSFDAALFELELVPRTSLKVVYVDRVHRIFRTSEGMSSYLFNGSWMPDWGRLAGYAYLLDYDRPNEAKSTATFGLRLIAARPLKKGLDLGWEVQAARQQDHGDNPVSIDADYLHLNLSVSSESVSLVLGSEVLGGNGVDGAFQTPLATLHVFNGWADKFLSTPATGLRDVYLELIAQTGPLSWKGSYHDFSSDAGAIDYGRELDFQVSYKTRWEQTIAVTAAFYDAERFSTDTTKIWIWTSWGL